METETYLNITVDTTPQYFTWMINGEEILKLTSNEFWYKCKLITSGEEVFQAYKDTMKVMANGKY